MIFSFFFCFVLFWVECVVTVWERGKKEKSAKKGKVKTGERKEIFE